MAGIHLPDIGKLGIHIATGINDKKKVAPLNMVENARLKAISNKIDSEKKDRYRVLNKEQKIMKMRDKRIRKRLEDINRSRTILPAEENNFECKRIARLPPLNARKKNGKESSIVEDNSLFNNKNVMVPSSPFSFFPIHEELRSFKCLRSDSLTILPLGMEKNKKLESLKNSRLEERGLNDRLNDPPVPRTTCPIKVDYQENVINYLDYAVNRVDEANCFGEESADERSYKPGLKQSLEDALQAIKACRYLRTPSTQTSRTNS